MQANLSSKGWGQKGQNLTVLPFLLVKFALKTYRMKAKEAYSRFGYNYILAN